MAVRRVASLTPQHVHQLWALYQDQWWSRGRRLDDVTRMIDTSDLVFAFEDEETQDLVAFARVVTDGVYKATIFDVIVRDDRRGEGLGALLLDTVTREPRVRAVAHLELYCRPEMTALYQRWGFAAVDDIRLMRLTRQ